MPKAEPHLRPLRQKRLEKRARIAAGSGTSSGTPVISSTVTFQVIGSNECGAGVNGRALMLYTDHQRLIFNCGEGTQRLTTEQCPPRALALLSSIFFTSRTWRNLGGFPGLCLTARASGSPDLTVHGPNGCMALFESVRDFILLYEFEVKSGDGTYDDGTVSVEPVELMPTEEKCGTAGPKESSPARGDAVLAYVITIRGKPGKLLVDRCKQLGVPSGPLMGQLKAGREIKLVDGRVVRPEEVMGPAAPLQKCLVIECPDQRYLEALTTSKTLCEDLWSQPHLPHVFHFTPDRILTSEAYTKWMNQFSQTKHVLVNDTGGGISSLDVLSYTSKLQMMAPSLFPSLCEQHVLKNSFCDNNNVLETVSALKFHIRPKKGLDSSLVLDFSQESVTSEVKSIEGVTEIIVGAAKEMVEEPSKPKFPQVTFLGTGASVPSKYRNVSGILVEIVKEHFILMDCGEGTLLQLYRHFGRTRATQVLTHLKAVYVSHLHADHHLGLISIIQNRSKVLADSQQQPLYLLAPQQMYEHFLSYYDRVFEPILDNVRLVPNEELLSDSSSKEFLSYCGLSAAATSRAYHCPRSFCVSFVSSSNFKLVYTGDTREPNPDLVRLGRGADLLIHEATMAHDLLTDAKTKRHSTFTEAVEGGAEMGAAFTLLTHFSQRYSKVPPLEEFRDAESVAIAFDNLSVSPRTFGLVRRMYQALERVFADEFEQMRSRRGPLEPEIDFLPVDDDKEKEEDDEKRKTKKLKQSPLTS